MKILLDIKDDKADPLLEVLNDLPYVKIKTLTSNKAKVLADLREAVNELNLVLSGKLVARDADELLNEL